MGDIRRPPSPFDIKNPSDGYFLAKREVVEALIHRADKYEREMKEAEASGNVEAHIAAKSKYYATEDFRNFVRNYLLWDTSLGK